jgi:hypothetical protein
VFTDNKQEGLEQRLAEIIDTKVVQRKPLGNGTEKCWLYDGSKNRSVQAECSANRGAQIRQLKTANKWRLI